MIGKLFVSLTHLIVAANYTLGVLYATRRESILKYFAAYCAIFTLLWLGVLVKGNGLMSEFIKITQRQREEEQAVFKFISS